MRLADTMVFEIRASPATSGEDGMDRGRDHNPYTSAKSVGSADAVPALGGFSRRWFRLVVAGLVPLYFLAGVLEARTNEYYLLLFVRPNFFWLFSEAFFVAQAGLLTLWLVWGPRSFARRLFLHWLVVLAFSLAFLTGFVSSLRGSASELGDLQNYILKLSILPAISLGLQLPLWPLRLFGGWRVERNVANVPASCAGKAREPLAIRDLLLGTFVAAIGLAGVRAAINRFQPRPDSALESELMILFATWSLRLMLVVTLFYLPALFLLMRTKQTRWAIWLWCGYLSVLCVLPLSLQFFTGGIDVISGLLGPTLVSFGILGAGLGLPLLLARRDGWRLRLPGDRAAAAAVVIAPAGDRAVEAESTP